MSKKIVVAISVITSLTGVGFISLHAQDSQVSCGLVRQLGVIKNTDKAFEGYTLIPPKSSSQTYLIRNDGQVVNEWTSQWGPGESAYLLPNGHLLRACVAKEKGELKGPGGGVQEFDWEGNLLWEYFLANDDYLMHHDIEPLPNGNVLALVIERKMPDEMTQAGFNPNLTMRRDHMGADCVFEIEKMGTKEACVVWEWHVWDHIAQNVYPTKDNYIENATDYPGRIRPKTEEGGIPYSWNHLNSIDYNAELDQIILSARAQNEIWILDHNITTEEAAGPKGDLLYRWGNRATYGQGEPGELQMGVNHNAQWIDDCCLGAGNILVFVNGTEGKYSQENNHSSIIEFVTPLDANGWYPMDVNGVWGPDEPIWTYADPEPTTFYSHEVSGCQRMPNGNTLICAGQPGTLFEVTLEGETVWEYVHPDAGKDGLLKQGEIVPYSEKGTSALAIFKVIRYAPDYPGLTGKDLSPKGLLVENLENPVSPALRAPVELDCFD